MKRLRFGGREIPVSASRTAEGFLVKVGEETYTLGVESDSYGTFTLRSGNSVESFYCLREGRTVHLFFRGEAYSLEEAEALSGQTQGQSGGLEAPMPGKVIKVNVVPGQKVSRGDEVLVVEAMKMENAVRAPRDGRVSRVLVKVGDMVAPGATLVEVD